VVDDQFRRDEGIDALGVATQSLDGVAHGAQIDDGGDAGEVLHEDAGRHVSNFAIGLGFGVPVGKELDVAGGDANAIFAAEQVLDQYLEAEGQAAQVKAARGERGEAVDGVTPVAGGERWRMDLYISIRAPVSGVLNPGRGKTKNHRE
jgi:hypothetical protein